MVFTFLLKIRCFKFIISFIAVQYRLPQNVCVCFSSRLYSPYVVHTMYVRMWNSLTASYIKFRFGKWLWTEMKKKTRKEKTNERTFNWHRINHSNGWIAPFLMPKWPILYLSYSLAAFFSFFSVALQCLASPIFLFAASMFHRFMNFLKIHKHTKDFLFGFILFASPALCDLWLTLPKIICTDTCSLYYSHNSRGPFL